MLYPNFQLFLLCHLLEKKQAEMTLNIVRLCRINPRMLAYASFEEKFNCNNTSLAPLGSIIIVGDIYLSLLGPTWTQSLVYRSSNEPLQMYQSTQSKNQQNLNY